jgi:hypothetical protein
MAGGKEASMFLPAIFLPYSSSSEGRNIDGQKWVENQLLSPMPLPQSVHPDNLRPQSESKVPFQAEIF